MPEDTLILKLNPDARYTESYDVLFEGRHERHPEYQGVTGVLQKLFGVGWSTMRTQEGRTGGAPQA